MQKICFLALRNVIFGSRVYKSLRKCIKLCKIHFLYLQADTSATTEEMKPETDNPDWFKDALKRAQAKAKELSEVSPGWLIFLFALVIVIYFFTVITRFNYYSYIFSCSQSHVKVDFHYVKNTVKIC